MLGAIQPLPVEDEGADVGTEQRRVHHLIGVHEGPVLRRDGEAVDLVPFRQALPRVDRGRMVDARHVGEDEGVYGQGVAFGL